MDAPLKFSLDQQLLIGLVSLFVPHNLPKLTYLHIYTSAFNLINCLVSELKAC